MTLALSIALAVLGLFAYVAVAGWVYRHVFKSDAEMAGAAVLFPLALVVVALAKTFMWSWNLGARRRVRVPKARVVT